MVWGQAEDLGFNKTGDIKRPLKISGKRSGRVKLWFKDRFAVFMSTSFDISIICCFCTPYGQ